MSCFAVSGQWLHTRSVPDPWHASPVLPGGTPAEAPPTDEQDHGPPGEGQCPTGTHAGVEEPGTGLLEMDGEALDTSS